MPIDSVVPAGSGRRQLLLLVVLAALVALAAALLPLSAQAQPTTERIGDRDDPVDAAIAIAQAVPDGSVGTAVLGRADEFPDNLAATALAGGGVLLLTDGGPDAGLPTAVAAELNRVLEPGDCTDGDGPTVTIAGGVQAVSQQTEDALAADRFCVRRADGPSRVETAIALADAVPGPSGTVVLARSDDWADAGAVGAWAARTSSRILVTGRDGLHPAVADALERMAPDEIVLVGGEAALSPAVADAAAQIAPIRRVAGPARDATAVAIAEELWADDRSGDVALAEGYGDTDWTYLFAAAPYAAARSLPILYTEGPPAAATSTYLDDRPPGSVTLIGPGPRLAETPPPAADLAAAQVGSEVVATMSSPLMLQARPGTGELWVAERAGRVRAIGGDAVREVLDISDTITTAGEGGLLGIAFHPDGTTLYTSSTDNAGDSVVDAFDIADDRVDRASRRQLITVDQPASNHNGGDLQWGPDGYLWWSMGDGGGGGDTFDQGQRPDTLLATMIRLDVDGGDPYAIPPDNPFADGEGGAPEVWAYGLRNPFRFAFDPVTDDLYIADVGQSAVEEINHVPAGTGAGSNFGWPIFEGNRPFRGGDLPDHVPPVWEELHTDGNCSITGGVVYRGSAIPELSGAYLYSDLCDGTVKAILVEGGTVTQSAVLGVAVDQPVGFGVDHDGEVYVLSLRGPIVKLTPG